MASFCPYCGRQVKDSDRFCIFCGKPLLAKGSAQGDVPNLSVDEPNEPPEIEKKEDESTMDAGTKDDKDLEETGDKAGSDSGEAEKEEKESKKAKSEPLSDEAIEQLEIVCELADIADKKEKIKKKVEDAEKLLKGDRVEWDDEYRHEVEIKLKALAQYAAPLTERAAELEAQKDENFGLVALPPKIARLKEQIEDLKRNTKFGKIKRDVYDELFAEYIEELKDAQQDIGHLIVQVNVFLSKKVNDISLKKKEIRRIKARRKSGELDEKEKEEVIETLEKEIAQLENQVKILKDLLKNAKT